VLLIAVTVSGFWAQQHFSASLPVAGQSSGCHGHNHGSPQKAPIHDCCLAGHDAALPQLSTAAPAPAESRVFTGSATTTLSIVAAVNFLNSPVVLSPESPGANLLRI